MVEDEEEAMEKRLKATVKTSLGLQRELYYDAVHRARLLGFTTREYIEVLLREDLRKPIEQSVAAVPGEGEVRE